VRDAATGAAIGHAELADRARRCAAGLRARGARRGDVLSLVAFNGPDFPIAMHGALSAGLTLAPANPLLTARELGALLRQVRARFLVADAAAMPTAAEAARAAGVEAVLALEALPADEPSALEPLDPRAIALLMSSSGTTGLPRARCTRTPARSRCCAASPPSRSRAWGPTTSSAGCSRWRTSSARSCSTRRCGRGRASSPCRASSSRPSWPSCRSTG
jgi:non-ribosomal peptide synthetase component F